MREFRAASFLLGPSLLLAACSSSGVLPDARPDAPEAAIDVALAGDNEVPPVATTASGRATAELVGNTLAVAGEFTGLESDLIEVAGSSAHVHEGAIDEAGPVVFNLDVDSADMRSGTFSGTAELTAAQVQLFEDGLLYVNIHTEENPPGELRGQLIEDAPELAAIDAVFDAPLSPEAEVAEVESPAEGAATAILRGRDLVVSGRFEKLTTPLTDVGDFGPAHVHEAPVGEDGPVVFPLDVVPADDERSGRFSVSRALTQEEVDTLLDGLYYVNIHTEAYPAGELRGQLLEREDPTGR